jgi:hypothetical protein
VAAAASTTFATQGKPAQVMMGEVTPVDIRGRAVVEPPIMGTAAVQPEAAPKPPLAPPPPKGKKGAPPAGG